MRLYCGSVSGWAQRDHKNDTAEENLQLEEVVLLIYFFPSSVELDPSSNATKIFSHLGFLRTTDMTT